MTAGFIGTFAPFTLEAPDQCRASPPHLTSGLYARDYNEVKTLGERDTPGQPSARTPEQTRIAGFFSDGLPTYWNGTARNLTTEHSLSLGDSARLFARLNFSMADAAITAWDSKVAWNFCRPITAIHLEGNASGILRAPEPPAPSATPASCGQSRVRRHWRGEEQTNLLFARSF